MGSADRRLVGSIFVAISSAVFIGGFPTSPWCLRRVVVTISADLLPLLRLFRGDTGKLAKLPTVGRGVPRIKTFFAALRKGHFWSDFLLLLYKMLNNAFLPYVGD